MMKPLRWKMPGVLFFLLLISSRAYANPAASQSDRVMDAVVLFLIYGYVFLIETTAIKFILYGRDGPSWLRAFMVGVFVNIVSAAVGLLSHVYYDADVFDFHPNFICVFGVSLAVESFVLFLMYARSYPKRALVTGAVMNVASYIFFLLLRFPE